MVEFLTMVALWCGTPNQSNAYNSQINTCREQMFTCIPVNQGPHMINLECIKRIRTGM